MNHFALGIGWRIALIVGLTGAVVALSERHNQLWLLPLLVGLGAMTINLYRYTTGMNRKLTRFMESVRYSDFAVAFRADSKLGPSFQHLNEQFNDVLGAFRLARSEKEASLHYVNTIVQHVSVGLLTFDVAGQVELVNQTALRLLGIYRLRTLGDLGASHPGLLDVLQSGSGTPAVYQPGNGNELSVRCTAVRLRGRLVTVASLQNIRTELQQRELTAWQNLTKVLRHEIMNSITPIVSLAGTMRDIVEIDLMGKGEEGAKKREGEEKDEEDSVPLSSPSSLAALNDLHDALLTIEQRGEGIMAFVDAYRHFTTIPQPVVADVLVARLLQRVAQLTPSGPHQPAIAVAVTPNDLTVRGRRRTDRDDPAESGQERYREPDPYTQPNRPAQRTGAGWAGYDSGDR